MKAAPLPSPTRKFNVAINQTHVPLDTSIVGATEVAFFPPVTGG